MPGPVHPTHCSQCNCESSNQNLVRMRTIYLGHNISNDPIALCVDCRNEKSLLCAYCGDRFVNEYITMGSNEISYCQYCFQHYMFSCHSCGSVHQRNDAYSPARTLTGGVQRLYCHECYYRDMIECYHCGNMVLREEVRQRNNNSFCPSCFFTNTSLMSETFEINKSKRTVGFELEYFTNRGNQNLCEFGRIHEDGSIRPTGSAWGEEFSSNPSNGDKLFEVIKKVCNLLRSMDAEVNSSCGFHVHIAVEDYSKQERENIKEWWKVLETVFLSTVAPSRRGNQYSQSISELGTRWNHDRYATMNITALMKHGTFEFRLHQGTLNEGKIRSWISLLLAFIETYSQISATRERLTKIKKLTQRNQLIFLFQQLNLKLDLRKYIVGRIKEFGPYIDIKTKSLVLNRRMSKSRRLLMENFGEPEKLDLRFPLGIEPEVQSQPAVSPPIRRTETFRFAIDPSINNWIVMNEGEDQ